MAKMDTGRYAVAPPPEGAESAPAAWRAALGNATGEVFNVERADSFGGHLDDAARAAVVAELAVGAPARLPQDRDDAGSG